MDKQKDEVIVPSFDEGGRKPSSLTSTADDGPRRAFPISPVGNSKRSGRTDSEPTATMPPEEAGNPDRNTM
jgi:hypothetical protein